MLVGSYLKLKKGQNLNKTNQIKSLHLYIHSLLNYFND